MRSHASTFYAFDRTPYSRTVRFSLSTLSALLSGNHVLLTGARYPASFLMQVVRPHLARRHSIGIAELLVELAERGETARERDVLERQFAFEQQRTGPDQPHPHHEFVQRHVHHRGEED